MTFFDDPMMRPPTPRGPRTSRSTSGYAALPFFEELPAGMPQDFHEELPADVSEGVPSIPEPGALMLVGLGLLGLSRRVRAYYAR